MDNELFTAEEVAMFERMLIPPELDGEGRVVSGLWQGKTVEEILAERDAYNRLCGE